MLYIKLLINNKYAFKSIIALCPLQPIEPTKRANQELNKTTNMGTIRKNNKRDKWGTSQEINISNRNI